MPSATSRPRRRRPTSVSLPCSCGKRRSRGQKPRLRSPLARCPVPIRRAMRYRPHKPSARRPPRCMRPAGRRAHRAPDDPLLSSRAYLSRFGVSPEMRGKGALSDRATPVPDADRGTTRCSPIWPSTRCSASEASRRPESVRSSAENFLFRQRVRAGGDRKSRCRDPPENRRARAARARRRATSSAGTAERSRPLARRPHTAPPERREHPSPCRSSLPLSQDKAALRPRPRGIPGRAPQRRVWPRTRTQSSATPSPASEAQIGASAAGTSSATGSGPFRQRRTARGDRLRG